MGSHKRQYRLAKHCIPFALLVGFSLTGALPAYAVEQDIELIVRPHCDQTTSDDEETMFGPIPDVEGMVSLGEDDSCERFSVEDPGTLRTDPLSIGDTLDFDVVVRNPSRQPIARVRSWLAYDTNVFEGISVEITEHFPLATPGESDFDAENGYVMIEAASEEDGANTKKMTAVARVRLRANIAPSVGTFISFYDVQRGGHTTVTTKENDDEEHILGNEPGGLHVLFTKGKNSEGTGSGSSPETEEEGALLPSDLPPPPVPLGNTPERGSGIDPDVASALLGDEATPPAQSPDLPPSTSPQKTRNAEPALAENGDICLRHGDCASNNCSNGICTERQQGTQTGASNQQNLHTAFALLQVQNVRATTEGSSLFLAWDPLNSSSLQAYNVYYGTTSGRYIQRKTISGTMKSVVLRNLPLGATYYLALRAVGTGNEESAFSREVSVEVGNPATSTAPLIQGTSGASGTNPVGNLTGRGAVSVPGSTGAPSALALLFILCAIVGTFIASKRQLAVCTEQPNS